MRAAFLLSLLAILGHCADRVKDAVLNLPGVTFEVNFKHYSGYLDATADNHLHYWLFESQMNPATAPLILWLNGAPFSNVVSGPLKENGPFHPTRDGDHLQENVFSWNKVANVLYIDSPVCSGSSYTDNGDARNNAKTVQDLIAALQKFVIAYPEYKSRDFFVAGELYGGIYVPELVKSLIETKLVELKLQGFAIGNGILRFSDSFNANLDLLYYRGIISKPDFDSLFDCCTASGQTADFLYCDFSYFVDISDSGVRSPKVFTDKTLSDCAAKVYKFGNDLVFNTKNSPFNTYQDCYDDTAKAPMTSNLAKSFQNNEEIFYDEGANQFAESTDAMDGFPCYVDAAITKYLSKPEVQQALHLLPRQQCSVDYMQNEWDMTDAFNSIIASGTAVRGLIYRSSQHRVENR